MKTRVLLQLGHTYKNRNGREYICKAVRFDGVPVLERVSDGWTLAAHGVCMYEDGTIEWAFNVGGHWTRDN